MENLWYALWCQLNNYLKCTIWYTESGRQNAYGENTSHQLCMGLTGAEDKLYKNLIPGLWHYWLTDTCHLTLESEFCSGSWKGSLQKLTAFQNYSHPTITLHIHAQYYIKTITMAIPQWDQRWTANTISTDGSSFHLSIKSNLHLLWLCLTTLEAIAIKILRYSKSVRSKAKSNHNLLAGFPVLYTSYKSWPWVLTGSLYCLCPLYITDL